MVLFVLKIILVFLYLWESQVIYRGCMRYPPMSIPISRARILPPLFPLLFFPSILSSNSFSSFLYAIQITGSL